MISFFLLTLTGCIRKNTEATSNTSSGRDYIVYAVKTLPKNLINVGSSIYKTNEIENCLFDGLVDVDANGNIIPSLAKKWEVSKDNLTYKFYIKDNITWSNGEIINAYDFEEMFINILKIVKQNNIIYDDLNCICGFNKYLNEGNKKDIQIKALDDKTLQIRLDCYGNNFLKTLAKPEYKLRKIDEQLSDYSNYYKDVLFSGAFTINNINDKKITLKKNQKYWSKSDIKVNKIVFTTCNNAENSLAKFRTGKIDMFLNPPLCELNDLIDEKLIIKKNGLFQSGLVFNPKKKYLNNEFKKCIASCIEKEFICKNLLNKSADTANYYIPSNLGCRADQVNLSTIKDKKTLKDLLEKSKFDKDNNLKLVGINNSDNNKIYNHIKSKIKKQLNLNINIHTYDSYEQLKKVIKEGNYDIAFLTNKSKNNNAIDYVKSWNYSNAFDNSGIVRNLVLNYNNEKDINKRRKILCSIQKSMYKDFNVIPICFYKSILCRKTRIENVYINMFGEVILKNMKLNQYS